MGNCFVRPNRSFNRETLAAHNKLRKLHGAPPLVIDWDLAKSAQAYATKLAKENKFSHSNGDGYGENLASSYNSKPGYIFSGEQATQNWYDEIKDYKFGQENQENNKIGHFSQVVWKDTKKGGFGRAQNAKGMFIVVGQYKPPGNYIGKYKENVDPPKGSASGSNNNQNNNTASDKATGCCARKKKAQ